MNTAKSELIYFEIGNKLNDIIPVKWSKILLYSEVQPGVVSLYYCFYEANTEELSQNSDINKKWRIDSDSLQLKEYELTKIIEKLNDEFANNNQERWSTITFILKSDGKINIDYGYEDLYTTDEITRRKQWKNKYLNMRN